MRTIQQLLADKPIALAHLESLIKLHDVWIVGGAARALLFENLPFPTDIDVLANNERRHCPLTAEPMVQETGSGGQGQKQTIGDVKFDVFENGLTKWLHGVPLLGDGLAVRAIDGFTILTPGAVALETWTDMNPLFVGKQEYLEKHRISLRRDRDKINELVY